MTVYANSDVPVKWERFLAQRTQNMRSSAIRELLKVTQDPSVISFAGGLPAPELFPVREIEEACNFLLREEPDRALQYSSTEGYPPLREYLADSMAKYGIPHSAENILITTGSQQALDLMGKVFVDPDTPILTGRPTYLGAIQAWRAYQARFLTVPLDEHGMQVEKLEEIVKQEMPRFIYVLPNFHNPAGTTLSEERRRLLVEIARKYDLIILEDDPYGQLWFEGGAEMVRPIKPGETVWGVATWENVDPRIDRFSIYASGLTNAYRWEDPPGAYQPGDTLGKGRKFTRKTLKLNFWRPGDEYYEHEKEFRLGIPGEVDYEWVYR